MKEIYIVTYFSDPEETLVETNAGKSNVMRSSWNPIKKKPNHPTVTNPSRNRNSHMRHEVKLIKRT